MAVLPPNHFLALPRPDVILGPSVGTVDTTTLAAHDFDVDTRTGFMPPEPPLERLPRAWELWEVTLQNAVDRKLKLGERADQPADDRRTSATWRQSVRSLPVLSTTELKTSEILLRRAHKVLAWIMHFYVHSLLPTDPIVVPRPIAVPLLQVSQHLALPPVLTYSDDVLYNWTYREDSTPVAPVTEADPYFLFGEPAASAPRIPTPENIRSQTLFTSTRDEEEFYLASARIELVGVAALELMQHTMDEAFVGDALALRRIAASLTHIARVVDEMTALLLGVRAGCDPEVFYHDIRPWFRGQDSTPGGRRWHFEGAEEAGLREPEELSGPSAGQSSIVHVCDIFLGVDNHSPLPAPTAPAARTSSDPPSAGTSSATQLNSLATTIAAAPTPTGPSFLTRMQLYMPRHHRLFLQHLASSPNPLRAFVAAHTENGANADLREGFNAAVRALRAFRDSHLRIVALYIIGPARRVGAGMRQGSAVDGKGKGYVAPAPTVSMEKYKGTGGTDLVPFLKSVRDKTAETEL